MSFFLMMGLFLPWSPQFPWSRFTNLWAEVVASGLWCPETIEELENDLEFQAFLGLSLT